MGVDRNSQYLHCFSYSLSQHSAHLQPYLFPLITDLNQKILIRCTLGVRTFYWVRGSSRLEMVWMQGDRLSSELTLSQCYLWYLKFGGHGSKPSFSLRQSFSDEFRRSHYSREMIILFANQLMSSWMGRCWVCSRSHLGATYLSWEYHHRHHWFTWNRSQRHHHSQSTLRNLPQQFYLGWKWSWDSA